MIQKKVCMLGAFAVGKTSLVRRFVDSIFDEKYLTTLGVKIDKKLVNCENRQITLVLWDLEGQDIYSSLNTSYLRGTSGYLLVVDGTRRETLTDALTVKSRLEEIIGKTSHLVLLNKSDLKESWDLADEDLTQLSRSGSRVLKTSAKTGDRVEEAFLALTGDMLKQPDL